MMHITRSIPYFEALLKSGTNRWDLLHKFPAFVQKDFIEVLMNIVAGNVKIGNYKRSLKKYQDTLLKMFKARALKTKLYILNQRFTTPPTKSNKNYFGAKVLHEIKKKKQYQHRNQDGDGFVWAALIPFFQWLASFIVPAVASGAISYGTKKALDAIENDANTKQQI